MNNIDTFKFVNEIAIISQLTGTILERVLPDNLTRAQFTVLSHFIRLGHLELTPAQLADAFQISRPTISSTLARMERDRLVKIRPDPSDGRGKLVSLTDEGRSLHRRSMQTIDVLLPRISEILGPSVISELLPHLVKLRESLDQDRNGGL
jgi:DNA-binding MarR family transcriptional regulator